MMSTETRGAYWQPRKSRQFLYWQGELVSAYLSARRARLRGELESHAQHIRRARWWLANVLKPVREVARSPLHPFCMVCGWRKGGPDSWNGKTCKCGHSAQPMAWDSHIRSKHP